MPSQWVGPVRVDLGGVKTSRGAHCLAVFVDKDVVICPHPPSHHATQLSFTRGALAGVRQLTDAGYRLVVFSQQRGSSLSGFDESETRRLALTLRDELAGQGITLHGFFACPHAPGPFGRPACLCRMPEPGLLRAATRALGLSLARSWTIGARPEDALAARAVNCRSVLVNAGNEFDRRAGSDRVANATAFDLEGAARTILLHDSPGRRAA